MVPEYRSPPEESRWIISESFLTGHLDQALSRPAIDGDLPIAPLEALIYLKLKSPHRKDEADLVELLRVNDSTLLP